MQRVEFSVAKNALIPADDEARAMLRKLQVGETVAAAIYRQRNIRFGNWVQLVLARLGRCQGIGFRNIRGWLAAQTGRADLVTINGKRVLVPWSTGEMSATEFHVFWEDALPVIEAEILPKLNADDRAAVKAMLEGDHAS